MATEFIEPEEKKDNAGIPEEMNILTDEPVIERAHTQKQASTGNTPVDEWTPPPFQGDAGDEQTIPGRQPNGPENLGQQQQQKPHEFANEELKDLSPNEKLEASEVMAKALVDAGSEGIKVIGNHFIKISPKSIEKLEKAGEINPNIQVNFRGEICTGTEVVGMYNEEAHDVLGLSDQYKEVTTKIVAKELAKRDIGMTEFQAWLYIYTPLEIKRLVQKGMQMSGLKNEIINAFKDASKYPQQHYTPPQPVHAASPIPTPAPEQQPEYTQQPEQQSDVVFMDPSGQRTAAVASVFDDIQNNRGQGGIIPPPIEQQAKVKKPGKPRKPYTKKKRVYA